MPWPGSETSEGEAVTGVDSHAEEAEFEADGEPAEEHEADEPINRGLLLKFLSSVRN